MNLRLSLIILAASLFMAIWDADQRAIQQHVLASRNAAAKGFSVADRTAVSSGNSLTVAAAVADPTHAAAPAVTASIPAEGTLLPPVEEMIPLPANLAAGTWAAVSDDGRRTLITVHETPAGAEQHFCITQSPSGRRWCFVRSSAVRAAASGDAAAR